MKNHKTTDNAAVNALRSNHVGQLVKAGKKIKADRNVFRGNPKNRKPPTFLN